MHLQKRRGKKKKCMVSFSSLETDHRHDSVYLCVTPETELFELYFLKGKNKSWLQKNIYPQAFYQSGLRLIDSKHSLLKRRV